MGTQYQIAVLKKYKSGLKVYLLFSLVLNKTEPQMTMLKPKRFTDCFYSKTKKKKILFSNFGVTVKQEIFRTIGVEGYI